MRDCFAFLGDSLNHSSNSFIEIINSSAHQWPLEGMTMSSGDTLNQNKSHLPPQCCWREDAASLFSLRDWLTDLDTMISSVWQYDSERWVLHAFQGCQNFHYKHLIKRTIPWDVTGCMVFDKRYFHVLNLTPKPYRYKKKKPNTAKFNF